MTVKTISEQQSSAISRKLWAALIMLGFVGSLCWGVENQFFNTFLYNNISPNPLAVSWMVAGSAISASLASVLIGTFSDRNRYRWGRKPFILFGYLLWGVFTAAFPLAAFLKPVGLAIGLAILFDMVMSFFGSAANDSNFHAYVTDISSEHNRGRVMGILQILSWVALLIVYGGAGFIIDALGYYAFFYITGAMVLVIGLIGALLLDEKPTGQPPQAGFWAQIASTFTRDNLRANRDLFLVLAATTLWGIAQQIYFPYLLIYLDHFLKFETIQASLMVFVAILVGGILLAYPLGLAADRFGRRRVALIAVAAEIVGLTLFSLARGFIPVTLAGIAWLAPYSAWFITTSAWSKDLFPADKRGQFAGYVIVFSVMFTMIPGPLLGGWLSTAYGIPTIIDGKAGTIPTPIIFQAGALFTLLAAIPLLLIRAKKTRSTGA